MNQKKTYEAPAVLVIELEPEGCLCSSGVEPQAHNELSNSHQLSNDIWGTRLWEDKPED